jgi:hypothetical protein
MKRNYFATCKTIEDLKKLWKKLALENHPDRGGNLETMQSINAEYDETFKMFQRNGNVKNEQEAQECPHEYRNVVERIINLDGIDIELCGSWIWVGGDTFPVRAEIKAAGFKWSGKKKMWYWHKDTGRKWRKNGEYTMDEIRATYGSQKIGSANGFKALTA